MGILHWWMAGEGEGDTGNCAGWEGAGRECEEKGLPAHSRYIANIRSSAGLLGGGGHQQKAAHLPVTPHLADPLTLTSPQAGASPSEAHSGSNTALGDMLEKQILKFRTSGWIPWSTTGRAERWLS